MKKENKKMKKKIKKIKEKQIKKILTKNKINNEKTK